MSHDLADDRREQREWLLGLAGLPTGVFVDRGCGTGEDLRLLGAQHSAADVRLIGVDAHTPAVTSAIARAEADTRVSFLRALRDAVEPLLQLGQVIRQPLEACWRLRVPGKDGDGDRVLVHIHPEIDDRADLRTALAGSDDMGWSP